MSEQALGDIPGHSPKERGHPLPCPQRIKHSRSSIKSKMLSLASCAPCVVLWAAMALGRPPPNVLLVAALVTIVTDLEH